MQTRVMRKPSITTSKKELSPEQCKELLRVLKARFKANHKLHEKIQWGNVEKALQANPEKLWSLQQLEVTGGEPDVIGEEKGEFVFGDCSAASPSGRRNVVFDKEAEEDLKKHYPNEKCNGNAADMVAEYGVDFMDETQYRELQKKILIDQNTWSWLKTPAHINEFGESRVALFGNRSGEFVRVGQRGAYDHDVGGSFRASLRV